MSDLLTREGAERLFKNWATVGVMGEVAALLLARADGTLQTREEFIDGLDMEAACESWGCKDYDAGNCFRCTSEIELMFDAALGKNSDE